MILLLSMKHGKLIFYSVFELFKIDKRWLCIFTKKKNEEEDLILFNFDVINSNLLSSLHELIRRSDWICACLRLSFEFPINTW